MSLTFTQAKKLILQAMRKEGIKMKYVTKSEIDRVAMQVALEAETQG